VNSSPTESPSALAPGTPAPSFTLKKSRDEEVSLEGLRGRPVILAFYPADWSPTCSDQLSLYQMVLPEFGRRGAELLGISVDGLWCHKAFAEDRNLEFPLLPDFEPKGAVARAYGVYDAARGISRRALFVIDAEGIIRWTHVPPPGVNPGAEGILSALDSLGDDARSASTLFLDVTERDHVQGPRDATVTVVEYGDYQCPYCRRAESVVKEVRRRAGENMRFVFRNFPLSNVHPYAERASRAAEAAALQGSFWPMHDRLFENQRELGDSLVMNHAKHLDLDVEKLRRDMEGAEVKERVREDFSGGVRSGVNGTPSFFINGVRHDDSWDADTLVAAIQAAAVR
jgi:peroxiredoxin/protein-disulfide isomerase